MTRWWAPLLSLGLLLGSAGLASSQEYAWPTHDVRPPGGYANVTVEPAGR